MSKLLHSPLFAIFLTVFIDLLGFGIVIPIIGPLFIDQKFGVLPVSVTFSQRTILIGFLSATFALAQFFSAPILGGLSDKYGRKKLLMICVAGTGLGYLLFALGIYLKDIPLMFLGRIIDGITGGNISIAMSAIADISTEKSKPKNFGIIGMAFSLGFILGPFLGGKLSDPKIVSWFTFTTPFFFSTALSILNLILIWFNFPETMKDSLSQNVSLLTGIKNLKKAFTSPNLSTLFLVVFLLTFSFTLFTQFLQVFFIKKFSWNQGNVGDYFAFIGFWIAITQGFLTRNLAKYLKPGQVLSFSLLGLSLVISSVFLPTKSWMLFLIGPFIAIFNGLSTPNLTTIISNLAGPRAQGEMLGINQSVQAIAQFFPLIMGGVLAGVGIGYPILASSFVMLLAWLVFITQARKTPAY